MKTTVNELASKLKKLKGFVPPKLDVVPGILYDKGTIIASNSELTVMTKLSTPSLIEERFIIPPRAVDLIASLPDGNVEIIADDKSIKIKSGTINSKFATVPADEQYPGEVDTEIENWEPVTPEHSKTLSANLKSIIHCCSVENSKPVYTGVRFDIDDNEKRINMVACDGFRIALTNESAAETARTMSISAKDIQKILSLEDSDGIQILQTKTKACFVTGEYVIYTKLLSGEFLNYKSAFPSNPKARLFFDQKSLVSCLERAIITAGGNKTSVTLISEEDADGVAKVHFIVKNAGSESDETIAAVSTVYGEINADYNAKYLLECFKAFGDGQIVFEYFGKNSPVIIDNGELKQMIMPVRQKGQKNAE